jgi:uncharacterized membrane protein YphA (DoxX/SURF4 family)
VKLWHNAERAPAGVVLVRLLVGGVFLSEGIQKFLTPTHSASAVSSKSASLRQR